MTAEEKINRIKEILSENVYRVAFLTKKQIKALKGGEDYGIKAVYLSWVYGQQYK